MIRPLAKFYLRKEALRPDTSPQNAIRQGLWMQGVELVDFTSDDEIAGFDDLGPDVGVAGYISSVQLAMQKMGLPLPETVDYPEELQPYLCRSVRKGTLGEIRSAAFHRQVFIKPCYDHKLFTGFVWQGRSIDRHKVVLLPDSVEIWICELVTFLSEYRVFVLQQEILDCRLYRGDWSRAPKKDVVECAVKELAGGKAPDAYCLDFGVLTNGATALVEMNDGFAFGPYGLAPEKYACMITARWRQLTGGSHV